MKVLIVTDGTNWCFGKRAGALQRYAPDGMHIEVISYAGDIDHVTWELYDIVFVLPTHISADVARRVRSSGARAKVITSHNSGLGRRADWLMNAMLSCDYVVINNYAVWAAGRSQWGDEKFNACNISNGVDTDTYRIKVPMSERPKRILWTASAAKAADDDDVKGFRLVLQPLKMILESKGWEVDYLIVETGAPGLTEPEIVDWYNQGAIIVCASTSEGTPNIILEGAACGCVPVTLPVGNVPELFEHGVSCVLPEEGRTHYFLDAIDFAWKERLRLSKNAHIAVQAARWSDRAKEFYNLFNNISNGWRPEPYTYLSSQPSAVSSMAGTIC